MATAYREAAEIAAENRYVAEWRMGVYVQEALISASKFYREWSKGADIPYPPRPLFGKQSDAMRKQEDRDREAMNKNIRNFMAMMKAANAKFTSERESAPEE